MKVHALLVGLLVLAAVCASDAALQDECNALLELKRAFTECVACKNWKPEESCCDGWQGVSCSGTGEDRGVETLALNGVSGDASSASLAGLPRLLDVSFESGGNLRGVPPCPNIEGISYSVIGTKGKPVRLLQVHASKIHSLSLTNVDMGGLFPANMFPDENSLETRPHIGLLSFTNTAFTRIDVDGLLISVELAVHNNDQLQLLNGFADEGRDFVEGSRITVIGNKALRAFDGNLEGAHVQRLELSDNPALEKLPRLPRHMEEFVLGDLPVLETLPHELPPSLLVIELYNLPEAKNVPMLHTTAVVTRMRMSHVGMTDAYYRHTALPASLEELDISGNLITWVPSVANHTNIRELDVSDNKKLVGLSSVPPSLQVLKASRCAITRLQDLSHTAIYELHIDHNELTELHVPPHIETLVASYNKLERLFLVNDRFSDRLLHLDLAYNELTSLTGDRTYGGAGLPSSLEYLFVQHNHISTLPGRALPKFLTEIDVSYNELTELPHIPTDVSAFDGPKSWLMRLVATSNQLSAIHVDSSYASIVHSDLQVVDVAHNALTRWADVRTLVGKATQLKQLVVAHNALELDDEPMFGAPFRHLVLLDASHNRFHGPVPPLNDFASISVLVLEGSGFSAVSTPACHADPSKPECLGWLRLGETERKEATVAPVECPRLVASTNPKANVFIDAAKYFNSALCTCTFGFYGEHGECGTAPANAIAPGGANQRHLFPKRGYWGSTQAHCAKAADTHEYAFQKCSRSHEHVCAPNNTLATVTTSSRVEDHPKCAAGYEGRYCAACAAGYFPWGYECRACPAASASAAVVGVVSVVLAVLVVALYALKPHADSAFKVFVFSGQVCVLLGTLDVSMPGFLIDFSKVWTWVWLEVPYLNGCLDSYDVFADAQQVFVMLAFIVAVPATVYSLGYALVRGRLSSTEWRNKNVRVAVMLFVVAYFRMAYVCVTLFQCREDACVGKSFFALAPNEECSGSRAQRYRIGAFLTFFLVLLGVPAACLAWALRNRDRLRTSDGVRAAFGFLYADYAPDFWYWEAIVTLRKLLLAIFAATIVSDSAYTPFLVALVLLLAFLAQAVFTPYANGACNSLERVMLVLEASCFASSVAFHSEAFGAGATLVGVIFVLVQLMFVVPPFLYLVALQRSKETGSAVMGTIARFSPFHDAQM